MRFKTLALALAIASLTFVPVTSESKFQQEGVASFYHGMFHGRKTANGERFSNLKMTAAHRTLPLGSVVRVTNLENGKEVVVRINDRGPYKNGRVIDLSRAAAKKLGMIKQGLVDVKIQFKE